MTVSLKTLSEWPQLTKLYQIINICETYDSIMYGSWMYLGEHWIERDL